MATLGRCTSWTGVWEQLAVAVGPNTSLKDDPEKPQVTITSRPQKPTPIQSGHLRIEAFAGQEM